MIYNELRKKESSGDRIRVGASAMGWMGNGFIAAMAHIPGMELSAVANLNLEEARQAYLSTGLSGEMIVEAHSPGAAQDALKAGKRVITEEPTLLAQIESLHIVTDVTWSPAIGAEVADACIRHGKDVVLINIEADVTVGHILKKRAKDAGVLYTVSSGDEPGCLMELYDFVSCLGYEIIAIGKGKNNPLDPKATPGKVAESARKAGKDPMQVASYVDGTKTMFEMTCAANATGCRPMQRGMTGPAASLENISQIFALELDGGISKFPGVVDFVQGPDMAGSVFVVVRVADQRIREDLTYLKVGDGKYFTFSRPFHLWFLEAPISIARANLNREIWMSPLDDPVAEIMTLSKRDLKPGDILDPFGGYTTYGVIDMAQEARRMNALPMGISPGARVVRPVPDGAIVTWDDVALDEQSTVVKLRRQQDKIFI